MRLITYNAWQTPISISDTKTSDVKCELKLFNLNPYIWSFFIKISIESNLINY